MTAYCTAAEIKTALNITSSTDDTRLGALADAVSTRLDRLYNLPDGGFAVAATSIRYYDEYSICEGVLNLDMPCLSVSTLVDAANMTIPADGFRLQPVNGVRKWSIQLINGYGWGWVTDGQIAVTGKFGWSTSVPNDVHEAAIMYAAWLHKRYQAALQDNTANQELGQLIYSEPIPKQVIALLPPKNGKAML